MLQLWGNASIAGKAGMAVAVATMAVAAAYAIKPSEGKLALMRPLSLATIFAGLATFSAGVAMILNGISSTGGAIGWNSVAAGGAEALAPLYASFTSLMVSWVLVAIGMRKS